MCKGSIPLPLGMRVLSGHISRTSRNVSSGGWNRLELSSLWRGVSPLWLTASSPWFLCWWRSTKSCTVSLDGYCKSQAKWIGRFPPESGREIASGYTSIKKAIISIHIREGIVAKWRGKRSRCPLVETMAGLCSVMYLTTSSERTAVIIPIYFIYIHTCIVVDGPWRPRLADENHFELIRRFNDSVSSHEWNSTHGSGIPLMSGISVLEFHSEIPLRAEFSSRSGIPFFHSRRLFH